MTAPAQTTAPPPAETPAAAAAPEIRRKFVCAGLRFDGEHLSYSLFPIDDAGELGDEEGVYDAKKWKGKNELWAGAVFSIAVPADKPNSVFIDAKYVETWKDPEDNARWAALNRLARTQAAAAKARNKARDYDALAELLLPLRAEYAKLIGRGDRVAFELIVLDALRRRP